MSTNENLSIENSKDDKKLILECHHCEEENTINLSSIVKCKSCQKPINGSVVKYKSNGTVLIGTFLSGLVAGAVVEDKELVSSEVLYVSGTAVATYAVVARAKLETEYKMMKKCIDKFGSNTEVRDNCFCVVKKMSSFITKVLSKDKDYIEKELEKKYKKCSSKED